MIDLNNTYCEATQENCSRLSKDGYTSLWELYSVDNIINISLSVSGGEIIIDGVQLEEITKNQYEGNNHLSSYKDYGSTNSLVYLKKAPDYCESYLDAPFCRDYVYECEEDEVGCQFYRPVNNDPPVPAIIKYPTDYCPAECVGYDTFKQEPTHFEQDGEYPVYLIPSTAKKCSSQHEGCDEFTNLDEVDRGGEGLEYYSYLRQCQKPDDDTENTCQTYYTWEGSDTTGYQLKTWPLKESNLSNKAPCTYISYNSNGEPYCDEVDDSPIFDKYKDIKRPNENGKTCYHAGDMTDDNPNCRQFYDEDGNIFYRFYSRTITCSEDCHPYRKTAFNDHTTQQQ